MLEQNLIRLTRVINTRNNIFSTMYSTTRWLFSFVHFIEKLSSDPVKFDSNAYIYIHIYIYIYIYIYLCVKVVETITVHENRGSHVLFWCIETNTRIHFGRKFFFFSQLILIQMFRLLKLYYLNIFNIKCKRNYHSSKKWAW